MEHSPSAMLWWLAPGLAHQLGNALFTLQGRARLLALGEPGRLADDSRAIQEGVERAGATLHLLRWLLDDGRTVATPVVEVLQIYAEAARVSLRDHGIALEVAADGEPTVALVDPGAVCRLVTATLREFAALVGGTHGTLRIRLQVQGEVHLGFDFVPAAGSPAVPRDAELLLDRLRTDLASTQARGEKGADGEILTLCLPIARATFRSS